MHAFPGMHAVVFRISVSPQREYLVEQGSSIDILLEWGNTENPKYREYVDICTHRHACIPGNACLERGAELLHSPSLAPFLDSLLGEAVLVAQRGIT